MARTSSKDKPPGAGNGTDLVGILKRSIEQVIDVDLFNQELDAEQADAAKLVAIQECCAAFFKSFRGQAAK